MPSSTLLKFSLEIGALGTDKFRVLEFTLTEAVSEGFHLRIEASSADADVKYADMIGKDATLTVTGEDFPVSHYGVVTGYNQHPDSSQSFGQESVLYDIVIEPHTQLMAYTTQNRVFQNLDIKAITTKVAADAGIAANFKFGAKGPFLEREYTVQYNETDLDFIRRLLEEEGICYYFDHEGGTDVMTTLDKATDVRPAPNNDRVEFMGNAGLSHMSTDHVNKMVRTRRMVTGKVTFKDYNDRTPEVKIQGAVANPGQGEQYTYAPVVTTTAEAQRVAALRGDMLAASKEVLEGEGICRGFRAGYRFELTEGGPSLFAGKYTLVRVTHHGDQREGFESDAANIIYTNTFTCIPAATVFRPAQLTPRPKIHGIITAKVDGQAGPYAYLDEEGRYHAKMPFDRTDLTDGGATLPIRMSQPYGGPNYGMHFPVHNGNDIVLGFIDGNVDRRHRPGHRAQPQQRLARNQQEQERKRHQDRLRPYPAPGRQGRRNHRRPEHGGQASAGHGRQACFQADQDQDLRRPPVHPGRRGQERDPADHGRAYHQDRRRRQLHHHRDQGRPFHGHGRPGEEDRESRTGRG